MKSIYKILSIFLLSILFNNCVKEVEPESTFEPVVFIFGTIMNTTETISITVSKTIPLNQSETNYVSDAEISLFTRDKNGVVSLVTDNFNFQDQEYTSAEVIVPIIENYYWIEVLVDGVLYTSIEELLNKPTQINNVTEVNNRPRIEFSDPEEEINFYLVTYENPFGDLYEFEISNDILFNGKENAFIDFSGHYYNPDLIINLRKLNYNTYKYYRNILSQRDENQGFDDESGEPGDLFHTPPIEITGNIINTSTNKYVLGNFGAVSNSSY